MTASHLILQSLFRQNMSQMDLCTESGIAKGLMSQIINEKRPISVKYAIKIARILKDVSARDLLIAQIDVKLKAAKVPVSSDENRSADEIAEEIGRLTVAVSLTSGIGVNKVLERIEVLKKMYLEKLS